MTLQLYFSGEIVPNEAWESPLWFPEFKMFPLGLILSIYLHLRQLQSLSVLTVDTNSTVTVVPYTCSNTTNHCACDEVVHVV